MSDGGREDGANKETNKDIDGERAEGESKKEMENPADDTSPITRSLMRLIHKEKRDARPLVSWNIPFHERKVSSARSTPRRKKRANGRSGKTSSPASSGAGTILNWADEVEGAERRATMRTSDSEYSIFKTSSIDSSDDMNDLKVRHRRQSSATSDQSLQLLDLTLTSSDTIKIIPEKSSSSSGGNKASSSSSSSSNRKSLGGEISEGARIDVVDRVNGVGPGGTADHGYSHGGGGDGDDYFYYSASYNGAEEEEQSNARHGVVLSKPEELHDERGR